MKRFLKVVGIIAVVIAVLFAIGPRPDANQEITFDVTSLPEDLDTYLRESEAKVANLRENAAKEILWQVPYSKPKTEYAVVYIHGFSASKVETAPVAQNVASALNANLYFTRLAGHGRDGNAMAEASMADWLNDAAEAIAIGERLGNKVILMSASTGSTISVLAMTRPELAEKVHGLVMISPNFAIHGAPTWLMNMPWAESILPTLMGAERSFEPKSESHANGWTHTYPTRAVFPMGALLKTVDDVDFSEIDKPALFIYSNHDSVVVPERTKKVISAWGGAAATLEVDDSENRNNHVIAGDILSANTTGRVSDAIIKWARSL